MYIYYISCNAVLLLIFLITFAYIKQKLTIKYNKKISELQGNEKNYLVEVTKLQTSIHHHKHTITQLNHDNKKHEETIAKNNLEIGRLNAKLSNDEGSQAIIKTSISKAFESNLESFSLRINSEIKPMLEKSKLKMDDTINNMSMINSVVSTLDADIKKLTSIFHATTKNLGGIGEEILIRILDLLGLKKDVDYNIEKTFGYKRPDISVKLNAEGMKLIIDAKNSLFIDNGCSKSLKDSYNKHIAELYKKNYSAIQGSCTYIIMFIPDDRILISDSFYEIVRKAYDKNIVVATPSTLGLIIKQQIMYTKLLAANANIDKAHEECIKIQKGCRLIAEDVENALKSSSTAHRNVQNISKRLNHNVFSSAQKMEKFGISERKLDKLKQVSSIIEIMTEEHNIYTSDNL